MSGTSYNAEGIPAFDLSQAGWLTTVTNYTALSAFPDLYDNGNADLMARLSQASYTLPLQLPIIASVTPAI